MKTLLINAPEQNNYNNPSVELKDKKLKKWLGDQPILNLIQSVPTLLARLPLLNEEPMTATQRIKLLEVYYESITSIFYSFDASRLQHIPVSDDVKTSITKGIGVLCQSLASGYKIIIKQALSSNKNHAKNKVVTLACFRATEMLFLGLMHAYRTYSASPPFNLLEFHQLYLFAEEHKFTSVAFPLRDSDDKIPLQQLYIRSVLITLSDPFRLPDGGLVRLNDFLKHHAAECNISGYKPNHSEGLFLIDMGSDTSPHPCSRLPENLDDYTDSPIADLRTLNVIPLIEQVTQKVNNPNESYDKELTLLNILLPNLQAVKQRRAAKRVSVEKQAHIATSIESLLFFISGNQAAISTDEDHNYGIQVSDDEPDEGPNHNLSRWKIKNEALRGFLLNCTQHCELVNVGQILGVAQNINNPKAIPFTLTVVRWLRNNPQGIMEIGVETIPGVPKYIQPITCENKTLECIQLDAIPSLKIAAAIITKHLVLQPGDILSLKTPTGMKKIQVSQSFEKSDYFDAFNYDEV
ncbi:MAG: hypothetical protein HN790_19365 [Methylococcales bacterium]|nr:hypothetical protein [Methylococcales bacterium]